MNGIIVINKDKGYTSFDVVKIVRAIFGEKHLGHTGTLDPNATGVLPICLGPCTRLIEYMDASPKTYVATARFGLETDTQDIWGEILKETPYTAVSKEDLLTAISHYIGDIEQQPSIYSAIRVKGRHLYSYARSNEKVEIPLKNVKIYNIYLNEFDESLGEFKIEVRCGRGTYIRTIINDIGKELGFGAVLTSLERTSACGYRIEDSVTLEKLKSLSEEERTALIRPAASAVSFMNRVDIDEEQKKDFANGKHLKVLQNDMSFDDPVCVFYGTELCGIGQWDNPNRIKPVKVFVR